MHRAGLASVLALFAAAAAAFTACRGAMSGASAPDAAVDDGSGGARPGGSGGSDPAGGGTSGSSGGAGGAMAAMGNVPGQTSGTQPPEAYVAKVKYLVNGGAVTPDEVAMVKATPAALGTLIDGWMKHPGFRDKMMGFFTEAFQQGGVGSGDLQDQFPTFQVARDGWVPAITSMFARTAWDIVDKGRPFTETMTTRRFVVNTALLVLLHYADMAPQDAAKREVTVYGKPSPDVVPPADFADSVRRRVFKLPDELTTSDPNGPPCRDPMTLSYDQFTRVIFGAAPAPNCDPPRLSVPLVGPADFEDWRVIEVKQVGSAGNVLAFYDLPALRAATVVSLRSPRVGFFSTAAFFAKNATNEDNLFRVTANQALIAALGRAFDDENVTIPVKTDALSGEHASPGTVCWSCHIGLDPMRMYFENEFETTYRGRKTKGTGVASFGFFGWKRDGGELSTFADALATHPEFPLGWTLRLCQWATSQPCGEEDPELLRVRDAFVSSKFDFKTLVRAMLSSPLVTGAAETATQKAVAGTIVSVTRRSHFCAAMATRLDLPALCTSDGPLARLVAALPDDEYPRGSALPMQPTQPALMYLGAVEVACGRIAALTVDGPSATTRFASADPAATVDALVTKVMGVPTSDPRFPTLRSVLADHAKDAGGPQINAWRSAFTLACTSPFALGIGL